MLRATLCIAAITAIPAASAQEEFADRNNSIRLEYQYFHTGFFETEVGALDLGETDTHVALLSGLWSLHERWTVSASVPYVQKRHEGAYPHDLTEFFNYQPPDLRIVDDGDYHGGFQDMRVSVQYLAIDGPLAVSPYIGYGYPMSNYPIYGSAAIGRNLWEVPVGVALEFTPYFSDWYFQGDIAYVFSESQLDVDLDYWLFYASASYYFTPRFAPRIFAFSRDAPGALTYPADFPNDDFDNARGYYHDVLLRHSYINAGLGFDYVLTDRYELSASYFKTIDASDVAEVEYAFTVALTRNF